MMDAVILAKLAIIGGLFVVNTALSAVIVDMIAGIYYQRSLSASLPDEVEEFAR